MIALLLYSITQNERETLKVDVVCGQIERKRLKYTLSESEKANSKLVYSTAV